MLPSVLCNIVIEYLTNPPKLPFVDSLLKITFIIKQDLEKCIYSPTFYKLRDRYIRQGKFGISHHSRSPFCTAWSVSEKV